MSVIEDKATAVGQRVVEADSRAKAFDMTVWVKLIEMVFQMLSDCGKNPDDVPARAKRPGAMGRRRLRQVVRHALSDDPKYDGTVTQAVAALLEEGRTLTPRECRKLMSEAAKAGT